MVVVYSYPLPHSSCEIVWQKEGAVFRNRLQAEATILVRMIESLDGQTRTK